MTRTERMNMLFAEDYRVIDFFPEMASYAEAGGFSDEVEQYYLQDRQLQQFCNQAISLVLKLLCCFPFEIYVKEITPLRMQREGWLKDKRCETIVRLLRKVILKQKGQLDILLPKENAIISIPGGTLSIAVYHESPSLKRLLDEMVSAEGFYTWRFRV